MNFFAHETRKLKERKPVDNFDGQGADLLYLLRAFIAGLSPDELVDNDKERYVTLTELDPAGRTLFVEVEAGWFGTAGKVTNTKTHTVKYSHTVDDATVRSMRFLAIAPKGALGMLILVEKVGGVNAAARILQLFHAAVKARYGSPDPGGLNFKNEPMLETQAWLERANLLKVSGEVTSYDASADLADGGSTHVAGRLSIDLEPEGLKEFLPRAIWTNLKNRELDAAQVLGLGSDYEVDKLNVTVSADGKRKTFAIDKEKEPSLSYLFVEKGEPDGDRFLNFCFDQIKDVLPSVGATWDNALKTGAWPQAALDETW